MKNKEKKKVWRKKGSEKWPSHWTPTFARQAAFGIAKEGAHPLPIFTELSVIRLCNSEDDFVHSSSSIVHRCHS